ncbi:hypothetical protein J6590_057421 [Homalodisca vitripennis]|nr:hypothetical protein J6590_057421 [Homalodisca vitripennis]
MQERRDFVTIRVPAKTRILLPRACILVKRHRLDERFIASFLRLDNHHCVQYNPDPAAQTRRDDGQYSGLAQIDLGLSDSGRGVREVSVSWRDSGYATTHNTSFLQVHIVRLPKFCHAPKKALPLYKFNNNNT